MSKCFVICYIFSCNWLCHFKCTFKCQTRENTVSKIPNTIKTYFSPITIKLRISLNIYERDILWEFEMISTDTSTFMGSKSLNKISILDIYKNFVVWSLINFGYLQLKNKAADWKIQHFYSKSKSCSCGHISLEESPLHFTDCHFPIL